MDARGRSPPHPPDHGRERKIEENDRVGLVDDGRPELLEVVAVHHPALESAERGVYPCAKFLGGGLDPVRPVVERVELDVRDAEALCGQARKGCLPGAASTHYRDLPAHRRLR